MRLLKTLEKMNQDNLISFHMPGHKGGRLISNLLEDFLKKDITEIPGADNLHNASGCILETEASISSLYESRRSRLLVGGSTSGVLASILGIVPQNGRIAMNRNAHQSVYNAVEIGGLEPVYIAPTFDNERGIVTGISQYILEPLLENVSALVLTYPTYEGICYPIKPLIECAHKAGIPVIVDEAHGAHLKFFDTSHVSALDLGADLVIQSFHKTLPAMTQTACLHVGKDTLLTDHQLENVMWYLASLQTSSPSYVLMASVDAMLSVMETKGASLVQDLINRLSSFYEKMSRLKALEIKRLPNQEITKIIIFSKWLSGKAIDSKLRVEFGIQSEYASDQICLLMTSVATTSEDLDFLESALLEIDASISKEKPQDTGLNFDEIYTFISKKEHRVYSASEVRMMAWETVSSETALGRISKDYIIPYPPGIPIVVPGEKITDVVMPLIQKETQTIRILR